MLNGLLITLVVLMALVIVIYIYEEVTEYRQQNRN